MANASEGVNGELLAEISGCGISAKFFIGGFPNGIVPSSSYGNHHTGLTKGIPLKFSITARNGSLILMRLSNSDHLPHTLSGFSPPHWLLVNLFVFPETSNFAHFDGWPAQEGADGFLNGQ